MIGTVIFLIAFIVLSWLAICCDIDVAWYLTVVAIILYAIYAAMELIPWQS